MIKKYAHYCKTCQKHWPCTHRGPEKQRATGPCGHVLILHHGQTMDELIVSHRLSERERGTGEVKYTTLKKEEF